MRTTALRRCGCSWSVASTRNDPRREGAAPGAPARAARLIASGDAGTARCVRAGSGEPFIGVRACWTRFAVGSSGPLRG